jgi:hypothetical protein
VFSGSPSLPSEKTRTAFAMVYRGIDRLSAEQVAIKVRHSLGLTRRTMPD